MTETMLFVLDLHADSILLRRDTQRYSESSNHNGETKRRALLGELATITVL